MAQFNPYLARTGKCIAYNVLQTANGWNVEVLIPAQVPASDKIKVLKWLQEYKEQIRTTHPLWSTVLHPNAGRYMLEIRKTNNDKELIETGEELKSICGDIMEYA